MHVWWWRAGEVTLIFRHMLTGLVKTIDQISGLDSSSRPWTHAVEEVDGCFDLRTPLLVGIVVGDSHGGQGAVAACNASASRTQGAIVRLLSIGRREACKQ